MLGLALLAISVQAQSPQRSVTFAEIEGKTPKQLASLLFQEDVARQVEDGAMRRVFGPGHQFGIAVWTKSRPIDDLFCHRVMNSTTVENLTVDWSEKTLPDLVLTQDAVYRFDQYGVAYPDKATDESCAKVTGYISPREGRRAASMAAVRQLIWAMEVARRSGELPFALDCRDEDPEGKAIACQDARAALANLPLPAMFGVEFDTGRYEQYPGMSKGIIRQVAPTREHPAVPTVRFGPHGDDGKSWFAKLEQKDGQLTAVQLSRGTVIYH